MRSWDVGMVGGYCYWICSGCGCEDFFSCVGVGVFRCCCEMDGLVMRNFCCYDGCGFFGVFF